jgi:hypothetical protein
LRAFERGSRNSELTQSFASLDEKLVIPSEARNLGFASSSPAPCNLPDVEIIWKSCGKRTLTGHPQHGMFKRFRGQSVSHLCEIAWTEFTPLRRSGDSVFDN